MDYAMKSLSLLTPKTLSNCVSASASMTQQLLSGRPPNPKPYRVTNVDRSLKKGIMADGLQDLISKTVDALHVSCVSALVLDEDGTGVDTEEFFQTLPPNTVFLVLEKGQKWVSPENCPPRLHLSDYHRTKQRKDVAKVTFDLYKNNPKDFIGCLNMKATLYGAYTVSYDLRCYAAKNILREVLRWTLFSMQTTGHILLGSSCYIEQMLDEEERAERGLALPQDKKKNTTTTIKQLQSLLPGLAPVY
ncbi:cell death activator CIDE-3 [Aplochiton taeniatus]